MRIAQLHPWRVSTQEAREIQQSLRERLRLEPLRREIRLVAAADVAYSRPTHRMYAAVVVVRLPGFEVVETGTAWQLARFPYIPGLFSFREMPPLVGAFSRLKSRPDAVLFDGQGLAHPRRLGLACHAGLLLATPTAGCAKSRLVGEYGPVPAERGGRAELMLEGDVVGAVVRTRANVSPVFVSPGHLTDVDSAVDLLMLATGRFRIPEPLRLAHRATTVLMRLKDPRLAPPRTRRYANFRRTVSAGREAPGSRLSGRPGCPPRVT
jgi:deoxyribonuclease V